MIDLYTIHTIYRLARDNPSEFNEKKEYHESILAMNEVYAAEYSRFVLKHRFEKGEYNMNIFNFTYYSERCVNNDEKPSFYYKFI